MIFLLALASLAAVSGCGRIDGPRFWWDDRNQARLDEYQLPSDPGAPPESGLGRRPSGDGITDDSLRDYRTNLDQEEEKRKSESSLLDF
jgi:hypothetical protein